MNILNKIWNNKLCRVFLITIVLGLFFSSLEYIVFRYQNKFSVIHTILYFIIYIFIITNVIFDYKKIWSFIFRYRYIIGIILFILCVSLGINTSSSNVYNSWIQPNIPIDGGDPIWGVTRPIRSDEFIATTPTLLSQALLGEFADTNPNIMAANIPVLMFPKLATWNISVLTNPCLLGFLFLNVIQGYSFFSILPYFMAFFGVFEFLRIVTKDNRLISITGTVMIVFSPTILWWSAEPQLAYGFICLVLFYKLINEDKTGLKILYCILLGWMGSCFIGLIYPAWQIPFGYLYLTLAIYLIIANWATIKKINFIFVPISIIIAICIFLPEYLGSIDTIEAMSNTVYPGARNVEGGTGWKSLLEWFPTPLYSLSEPGNPCEWSSFISFYPIPTIIGFIVCIRNIRKKEYDIYLILLTSFSILFSIWNFIPIGFVSKLTLLNMSTPSRSDTVVALANVLIIIKLLDDYTSRKRFSTKILFATISVITVLIIPFILDLPPGYMDNKIKLIVLSAISFTFILLLLINNNKSAKLYCVLSITMSLFFFITINPVNMGLHSIFDKPVSKEIQAVVKEDPNSTWISVTNNGSIWLSNYALANGAKIINSVNFFPQLNVWNKLDPEKKYKDIYNRYAHITFTLTNENTSFILNQTDSFSVNLNINDIKKLNINKIISENDNLEKFSNDGLKVKKVYCEDKISIYEVIY